MSSSLSAFTAGTIRSVLEPIPIVQIGNNANQTLTATVLTTPITFQLVNIPATSPEQFVSGSSIICRQAGTYRLSSKCQLLTAAAGLHALDIYVNGVSTGSQIIQCLITTQNTFNIEITRVLAAGAIITAVVTQPATGSAVIAGTTASSTAFLTVFNLA